MENLEKAISEKLERSYNQVPKWESLLCSVKDGEALFVADIKAQGLDKLGIDTSRVHAYSDIEAQAFIVGIPSINTPEEIALKSYLVYGAHWLDDFFDNPSGLPYEELFQSRDDIKKALSGMGNIGQAGFLMADKTPNPEGVYKGIARMLYGGLVQRSNDQNLKEKLLQEYQELGLRWVDKRIAEEIKTIQPEAYWTTNKVLMEFMNAAEKNLDFTVSELWNIIYAPALYYHDISEEERIGESSFTDDKKPSDEQMAKMIKIGVSYLSEFTDDRLNLRIQQLEFLLTAFRKNLPSSIILEYQSIINQYGHDHKA